MREGLIALDARERMVPTDRDGLAQEVARLLASEPTVSTLRQAGIGLVVLGEFDRAEQVLTDALTRAEAAEAAGEPWPRIAVRINLGDAYRYRGALAPAEAQYQDAVRLARAHRPDRVDFALQHLGKCRLDQRRFNAAAQCLREALALRQQRGDPELVASSERTMGLLPAEPAVDGYVICGTPRTGSTLLCSLLRSTGVAGRPESYFRRPDAESLARRWELPRGDDGGWRFPDFLAAAIAAGSTPNGIFGVRIMWGTLDELVAQLRAAAPVAGAADVELLRQAFGRLRFVYVERADTVAQAVSWARAEQTKRWQVGDAPSQEPPRYDRSRIAQLVETIEQQRAAWRRWFAEQHVEPYEVSYEELAADPTGVTEGVLDSLELVLPPGAAIRSRVPRQADELNADWIARFRAVA
ncbi:sulfotransferase [Natronosporangium hydrolyticum]|uniref:Sulfotransferase n=1 Tax=Natronosporangium hydrolyticum TaxID=2811111 RepID=A0A895YF63_9ACTN|nr:Stf0 family sulfotransferase [Natronosporangium hydrolyticum]QSB13176.1 sulfotransferase [Natronosporangium hydrolyticum]